MTSLERLCLKILDDADKAIEVDQSPELESKALRMIMEAVATLVRTELNEKKASSGPVKPTREAS